MFVTAYIVFWLFLLTLHIRLFQSIFVGLLVIFYGSRCFRTSYIIGQYFLIFFNVENWQRSKLVSSATALFLVV